MTVAPSSPPPGAPAGATPATASPPPGEALQPQLDWLEGTLRQRLRQAAEASGMSVAAVCEQWLREGLERFEAHHPAADHDGSGRCSLRTGSCTVGPVPLPVQQ